MSETLLEKISNAAKERFQNIAFPTRKDEYWRFAYLDTWSVDTLFPYFTGRPPEEGCNSEFEDLEHEESQGGCVLLFDGQLLDGEAEIKIGGKPFVLKKGDFIIMPANVTHALSATENFKMTLTMIKTPQ